MAEQTTESLRHKIYMVELDLGNIRTMLESHRPCMRKKGRRKLKKFRSLKAKVALLKGQLMYQTLAES